MKFFTPKVQKLPATITPFAGISFVNNEFNRVGMTNLIDKELGMRVKTVGYTYSEIIRNQFNTFFCGGDCMEDITSHLRPTLKQIPDNRVPSPDTLGRGMKELSVDNTTVVSVNEKTYNFNINHKLNLLNIKTLLLTRQLQPGESYDFDYDNQILAHNKFDAKTTYKKNKGYCPGVATIGDKIVYVENRDGNANVKTDQAQTLTRAYALLESQGVKANRSRMDAGSYSEEIIKVVAAHSNLFYIRANKCQNLFERLMQVTEWENVEINFTTYGVCSLPFEQFEKDQKYRLVVMREKVDDAQLDLFLGEKFSYRCILTNDQDSTEKEIIEYYNQRGASEKTFDIQNNDFGWSHMPFSDMHHNTVYLIVMAMAKNFYNYIVGKVAEVFEDIQPTTRMKRFIFRFISVPGKWIYQSRQWILRLYTDKPYEKVFR